MMLPGSSRWTLTFHCCMCGTWFVVNTPPVPPPMPRPRLVDAPSELPGGRLKPSGNGLSIVRNGVRPSRLTIMSLCVLKPIMPADPEWPAACTCDGM